MLSLFGVPTHNAVHIYSGFKLRTLTTTTVTALMLWCGQSQSQRSRCLMKAIVIHETHAMQHIEDVFCSSKRFLVGALWHDVMKINERPVSLLRLMNVMRCVINSSHSLFFFFSFRFAFFSPRYTHSLAVLYLIHRATAFNSPPNSNLNHLEPRKTHQKNHTHIWVVARETREKIQFNRTKITRPRDEGENWIAT